MCLTILMIWSSITLAKFLTPFFTEACFSPGGDHGLALCQQIEGFIGTPGLTAFLVLTAIAFLTYLSMETIIIIRKLFNPLHYLKKIPMTINVGSGDSIDNSGIRTVEDPSVFDNPQTEQIDFPIDTREPIQPKVTMTPTANDEKAGQEVEMTVETGEADEKAKGKKLAADNYGNLNTPYDPKRDLENYHYPTLDLLQKYESDGKPYIDMQEQTNNKNRIVDVLRNFGVEISSIKATVGPTITLYEITPAPGVRISKIRNLEDDIALSLSALGIRIIAPIPGKGTIGIEVPNAKPAIVSMESILNSKKFQESTMELPCALGKTITNEVFMFDLAKAPHLLVAGATGQGKSVGLNAIITSLLYKKHPAEMKIVLVDPKKVEFSVYATIEKHFLAKIPDDDAEPIITDVTKVIHTLNSLCKEMDTRYDLLKMAQARNIKEYNKKFIDRQLNPEHGHKFMPYIVVVIDEFGDLIMTAGKEVELPIARIAQLARAVGIHMIIATQRPTTNIITGTIKANFPSRIAFKVSAGIDSKTILDRTGAQQLVGRGDMLYLNGSEPVRVQCAFVDTPEVERINSYISQQQGYACAFELPEPDMADEDGGGESRDVDMQHLDPMFEDAARLIVREQSGSTSLIQRKFAIGYNRAGRLMDQLEKAGIVGAAHGSKPREVLIMDEVSLEKLISGLKA
jgi:S-DNA-T family DNA segregation ATPase FtsK/SpoIIIE